jgi:hypothetical protein
MRRTTQMILRAPTSGRQNRQERTKVLEVHQLLQIRRIKKKL